MSTTTRTAPETSLGSLNRINFEGSNVGATMFIRRCGTSGELPEGCCCCVNMYSNSNVQGTNGSVSLGSNVRMKNCGVHLYFGDLKSGEECSTSRSISRRAGGAVAEFGAIVLLVLIALNLFIWLSSLLMW